MARAELVSRRAARQQSALAQQRSQRAAAARPAARAAMPATGVVHARRTLFITTEDTPNPDSFKFYPTGEVVVTDGRVRDYNNRGAAIVSPLAKRLFGLAGVRGVMLSTDFLTVVKESDASWPELKPLVFGVITEHYASNTPAVDLDAEAAAAAAADTGEPVEEDDETVAMIKEILETRVRPAVQEDGGDVEFAGFKEGVVLVKMQGSCSGCPSSSMTLKSGIERMLMHYVPEVMGVAQVTDDLLEQISAEQLKKTEAQAEQVANA